jgi:hypothetical protein
VKNTAQASDNETRSYEVNPKHMSRNPGWDGLAYALGIQEVFNAEHSHGQTDKYRAEEYYFIQPPRLLRGIVNRYPHTQNQ